MPCVVGGSVENNDTTVNISTPDGSDGVSIILELTGLPTTGTTYTGATVIDSLGDFKSIDKTSEWEEQASNGADTEGTFTLTFTNIGAQTDLGASGKGYSGLHGTFVGTFVAKSGGTGTSMLNITF